MRATAIALAAAAIAATVAARAADLEPARDPQPRHD
jgi:hypothetical protein